MRGPNQRRHTVHVAAVDLHLLIEQRLHLTVILRLDGFEQALIATGCGKCERRENCEGEELHVGSPNLQIDPAGTVTNVIGAHACFVYNTDKQVGYRRIVLHFDVTIALQFTRRAACDDDRQAVVRVDVRIAPSARP